MDIGERSCTDALTVDHGLRAESAAEAKQVGTWCADMGVAHEILIWSGEKPKRRIQEVARRERYDCCKIGAFDWGLLTYSSDIVGTIKLKHSCFV